MGDTNFAVTSDASDASVTIATRQTPKISHSRLYLKHGFGEIYGKN
jgi:hypothetical protein